MSGVNVFMRWAGMSRETLRSQQYAGFNMTVGERGYLRWPNSETSPFPYLFKEGWTVEYPKSWGDREYSREFVRPYFEQRAYIAYLPEDLEARLPATLSAVEFTLTGAGFEPEDIRLTQESITAFVRLYHDKWDAGLDPRVYVSRTESA